MRKEFSEPLRLCDPKFEPDRLPHCALSTHCGRIKLRSHHQTADIYLQIKSLAPWLLFGVPNCDGRRDTQNICSSESHLWKGSFKKLHKRFDLRTRKTP